ncbi:sensor histidine kinase [Flavihumibacter sp. UBA7668]|uniref:sensor histidine kinase n=1 Tax=Flavihumibacter sp. UBA7668 TaxID=1946542 RepID=UPI0025C643DA|nr:histidine kinase [Flavihumibacter sp. UBA7668]
MPSIPFNNRSLLVLSSIFIYLIWQINFFALLSNGYSFYISITESLLSSILLAFVTVTLKRIFKYYTPNATGFWVAITLTAGFSTLLPVAAKLMLESMIQDNPEYLSMLNTTMQIRIGFSMITVTSILVLILLFNMLQKSEAEKKHRNEIQQLATEAELFKLRQQLQPHFLFNSLNSINALIGIRPQEARNMTEQLASFLRGTIHQKENKLVALKEELDQINRYLQIEKLRFGHRLQVKIQASEEDYQALIPPLLLQPLVENAIKFGLYETTEEVDIELTTLLKDKHLYITVSNPFDPETPARKTGTGFGLSSVQRRLYLLFGRSDLLQVKQDKNIFITTVTIPQLYAESSDN